MTLLELANAYRAIANGGLWRPYRWWAAPPGAPSASAAGSTDERRIMSARAAALVLDILADPVARIPGFGLDTPFDFPFPVAVKTGTSRHFTDNWAVGTTGGFTVAVWAGNFSGRPMDGVSGVTGAGPLLHRVILLIARLYPPGLLPTPAQAGSVPVTICRLSGLRAGPDCPGTLEWFAPGTEPQRECDWHRSGEVRLPLEYAEWADQSGFASEARKADRGVVATRTATKSRNTEPFLIVSPQAGDRYEVPPTIDGRYATIALRAAGGAGAITWWVDGQPVSALRWRLAAGMHSIRAVTTHGQSDEVHIEVAGSNGDR